ncbi:MAG: glycosyl hydrolase 115 family protein [Bacteroidales bacterium]|nr:MAG: glycosyl hydrolase 115 family protein [Bacteroidales bacterium]
MTKYFNLFSGICLTLVFTQACKDAGDTSWISTEKEVNSFTLSARGQPAPLFVSDRDYQGVILATKNLKADIGMVTNKEPQLFTGEVPGQEEIIIVGTIGKSPVIDKIIENRKLNVKKIRDKWETFVIEVLEKPLPGIERALVIAGSDKRGTIYGIYELSAKIGVSPWYWWADVPVMHKPDLYVMPGRYSQGEPGVKYRGIFINDEAPALSGWAYEKFGGFNHKFYEKVFELILRLKGNYLWPAMWGRAFYADDTLNPKLADEYGVVIGTSHHEPLMRAHAEWRRFGSGRWNYELNEDNLKEFWREGIRRMGSYESIVTIGMRGDGDEPMTEGTAIALLERIVKNQREIIEEVTGKPKSEVPQKWALYKEVQDYYDKGMRVPDDVTLLLCDDNWGNIRKLPRPEDAPRSGGYGIYYHFDYVGGPRNYKWLNTNPIARVWEQMHLAYHYRARQIWIVNVGDIKPMEFPVQFFLDYAWDPEKWPAYRLPEYTRLWAKQQFGDRHSEAIADILTEYTKYNGRRKPELLDSSVYSLTDFREAETIVADYNKLASQAEQIYDELPSEFKDAYYQLVLFPVKACANLNDLHVSAGRNHLYAKQRRAATNILAQRVRDLFVKDAELTDYFHTKIADGKWNHIMSQTHIGYTYWQQPEQNNMPEVKEIILPDVAEMGVAIEGSESWWPMEKSDAVLPGFDPFNQQKYYIEVFNRGQTPFDYVIETEKPWLFVTPGKGKVDMEKRVWVDVDWEQVPKGIHNIPIKINGPDGMIVIVRAEINNEFPEKDLIKGFVESNGYVSMEAEHYTRAVNTGPVSWLCIPDLGRTLSGMTPVPVTAENQIPGGNSPRLEYQIQLIKSGEVKVKAYLSPTLNFHNDEGLCYAVSIDDEQPQIINIHKDRTFQDWEESVRNNITIGVSSHNITEPGKHVLKYWMVDPGIVLQKLVVETDQVRPSYLGPPESYYSP